MTIDDTFQKAHLVILLQAIDWMRKLDEYKLHWIEEPTSADDVLGHKIISQVRRAVNADH